MKSWPLFFGLITPAVCFSVYALFFSEPPRQSPWPRDCSEPVVQQDPTNAFYVRMVVCSACEGEDQNFRPRDDGLCYAEDEHLPEPPAIDLLCDNVGDSLVCVDPRIIPGYQELMENAR